MARLPRLYAPGLPQYVLHRAVSGRRLFVDDDDYRAFVELLGEATRAHGVALHAYVLLPDEMRFLATPAAAASIPRALQAIGRRFVPAINRKTGLDGPLWTRRYRSTVIDPDALLVPAMLDIERRPVAAGLAIDPAQWRWSSHRHHVGLEQNPPIADHAGYWSLSDTPFERQALYRMQAADAPDPTLRRRFDQAVEHGWALGDGVFLASVAGATNRRVMPLPRGRQSLKRSVPD